MPINNIFKLPENESKIEAYSTWLKVAAVLGFITGGSNILTIVGLPFGVFMIIASIKLWESSEKTLKIKITDKDEEINKLAFDSMIGVSKFFKYYVWGTLVMTIISVILVIFIIILALAYGSTTT